MEDAPDSPWAASYLKEESRLGLRGGARPLGLSRWAVCLSAWWKGAGSCSQAGGQPLTFWSGSQSLSYYYFLFFFFFELLRAIYRNHLGAV